MDFNIEPRYGVLTQAYSAAHLAGSTKKKERRRKLSSTKGNAQGKSHLVSYVPMVLLEEAGITYNHVHTDTNPHVTVTPKTKWASWKTFEWEVI